MSLNYILSRYYEQPASAGQRELESLLETLQGSSAPADTNRSAMRLRTQTVKLGRLRVSVVEQWPKDELSPEQFDELVQAIQQLEQRVHEAQRLQQQQSAAEPRIQRHANAVGLPAPAIPSALSSVGVSSAEFPIGTPNDPVSSIRTATEKLVDESLSDQESDRPEPDTDQQQQPAASSFSISSDRRSSAELEDGMADQVLAGLVRFLGDKQSRRIARRWRRWGRPSLAAAAGVIVMGLSILLLLQPQLVDSLVVYLQSLGSR